MMVTPLNGFSGFGELTVRVTGDSDTTDAFDSQTVSIRVVAETLTVPVGAPLHLPLDGFGLAGENITYDVVADDAALLDLDLSTSNRSLRMDVAGFGQMTFELFEDLVPDVTQHLIDLAARGFYDGLSFFMTHDRFIQGGDPNDLGLGTGVPRLIDDQFSAELQHTQSGALSLIKTIDDWNASQFLISGQPLRDFDFQMSVLGHLVTGDDVRQQISEVQTTVGGRPISAPVISSMTVFEDLRNGLLRVSAATDTGSSIITITATNEAGETATETVLIQIEADSSNSAPFLVNTDDVRGVSGRPLQLQLESIDVEGDAVRYFARAIGDIPYDVAVDQLSGEVVVTPPRDFVGDLSLQVSVAAADPANRVDRFDRQVITVRR